MKDTPEAKLRQISPALDFLAGTVAGMAAVVVGYPFDTVKVRFQSPQIASKYRSTLHAILTIIREERMRGLYRGIAAPLAGAPPLNGLVFSSYRSLLRAQLDDDQATPTLTQVNLAGAGTGIICSLITTPAELVKIHQQTLVRSAYSAVTLSDRDVILHIWRTHGLRGFYRGITATALRDIGYGAYFAAYEATLRYWPRPHASLPEQHSTCNKEVELTPAPHPWLALLTAGGMAGIAGWIVTFPFDVVKTRVQSTPANAPNKLYRSTWSTIIASYRAEGVGVFFRGLAPTLIRAIPVNMVTFATFEAVIHLCS
ncbi:mitochondrial carrier [Dichomitus squalens]|uniref:Mitochondrial carrier n=1 Tax=Dichomitus squalens TaxID=114155 RepID=A0A4Q9NE62_9APHY|nr:mitochondrial carrier [Dichomitus squalens]TBU53236.1 mitochondrial carrier [Dichomitus squalens]